MVHARCLTLVVLATSCPYATQLAIYDFTGTPPFWCKHCNIQLTLRNQDVKLGSLNPRPHSLVLSRPTHGWEQDY